MTLFEAVVLGVIQGLSEFLPVSSSGHLLAFQHLFGIREEDNLTFMIALNMGSLVPLLWVFRGDLLALLKNPFQKLAGLLALSVLPVVAVTALFLGRIEAMFQMADYLWAGFVVTGVLLLLSERLGRGGRGLGDLGARDALLVGLVQAFAVFPGLSRSGSTIVAGLWRGLDKESAAKFSFLMSIPTAFGAVALRIANMLAGRLDPGSLDFANLSAGFLAAAVAGYFSINAMLAIVKKAKLKYFALYYIAALVALLLLFA